MRYSKDWEDYELIDCSSGYKLERWSEAQSRNHVISKYLKNR